MADKMKTQYRGCTIPLGLTKDTAHILDVDSDCCATAGKLNVVAQGFCPGISCAECICYSAHRKELKELLKMWKEEDNPIKPGMVVKSESGNYYLVFNVEEDCINGWAVMDTQSDVGKVICELRAYVRVPLARINEVYKIGPGRTMPDGADVLMLVGKYKDWDKYWEEIDPPVLELTVEDIEKKYGRKVRIVKGS